MMISLRLALAASLCLTAAAPQAQMADPALKTAFAAMEQGPDAARAAMVGADPLQQDVLSWVILRESHDPEASFRDHLSLIRARPQWPVDARMQTAAEALIIEDTATEDLRAYFAGRPPRTMAGLVAYLGALDDAAAGQEMLAQVWPRIRLSEEELAQLVERFPKALAPHHEARADALAWAGRTDEAAAMGALLRPAPRAELAARVAYMRDAQTAGVLDAGRGDVPALAYARMRWMMRKGDREGVIAQILARQSAEALGQPERWARDRLRLARWALDQGKMTLALDLAGRSYVQDGSARRAALDWFAGHVALDHMNAPQKALAHFQHLRDGVRLPISVSRAWYWIARAQDRLEQPAQARAARIEAARHQVAFYGQLAAEEAGLPFDTTLVTGALGDTVLDLDNELLRALDLLVLTGQRGAAYEFAAKLGQDAPSDVLRSTALRLLARGEYFLALRLGKAAGARGLMLPEVYFPLHPMVELEGVADPALALAIARQESEFRPDAGSHAGALGLMQLMPGTAERTARKLGLDYARGKLTSDWRFNARLGTAHLDELREMFGDSPVLIAAGYNAGAGRARDWIARNGDPRDPDVDPIAWIEAIPFDETRNYVMRVIEAIRPYEARLTGQAPTRSLQDLLRGAYPLIRPRARPASLGRSGDDAADAAGEESPQPTASPSADETTAPDLAPASALAPSGPVPRPRGR